MNLTYFLFFILPVSAANRKSTFKPRTVCGKSWKDSRSGWGHDIWCLFFQNIYIECIHLTLIITTWICLLQWYKDTPKNGSMQYWIQIYSGRIHVEYVSEVSRNWKEKKMNKVEVILDMAGGVYSTFWMWQGTSWHLIKFTI